MSPPEKCVLPTGKRARSKITGQIKVTNLSTKCSLSRNCKGCRIKIKDGSLSRADFSKYFPWFLADNPSLDCPSGGHALYSKAVRFNTTKGSISVGDSFYMAFNTVLKKSKDFTQSMIEAREICGNISKTMNSGKALIRIDPSIDLLRIDY